MKFLSRPTSTKSALELIAAKLIGQFDEVHPPHDRHR
jgi:hypothetical protein